MKTYLHHTILCEQIFLNLNLNLTTIFYYLKQNVRCLNVLSIISSYISVTIYFIFYDKAYTLKTSCIDLKL